MMHRFALCFAFGAVSCHPAASKPATPTSAVDASTGQEVRVPGYGEVQFVARPQVGTIERIDAGQTTVLAAELPQPRALVLRGADLVVGTSEGLVAVSLASGEVTPVAPSLGPVSSVALDHVGYVVAAVEGRGLFRVPSEGTPVQLAEGPVGRLRFETDDRTLVVSTSAGRDETVDYLALVGDDPATWAARDARPMGPFEAHGIMLAGAEYWPYRGDEEPEYPQDVLWGFYPERGVVFEGAPSVATATPEAVACAEQSHRALRAFVEAAPPAFWDAVARGRSPRFYLWVNDYSQASASWSHEVRPGRLWYWKRSPAVPGRVPGYWKWETTLTREGECQIPEPEQIEQALREAATTEP